MPTNTSTKPKKVKTGKKVKKVKKEKKSESVVIENNEPAPAPPVEETPVSTEETTTKKRTRRVVNKESILNDIDSLITSMNADIDTLRNSDPKNKKMIGVKSLRSYAKRLNQLRNDANRSIRERKTPVRSDNQTSGFMKPVPISKELAQFTGWNPKDEASRVQVTKFLCDYIKTHQLQADGDRRQINPDKKLKKLLTDDPKGDPLTYYSLQRRIQHHFR